MSVKGVKRYKKLINNISNWQEYVFHKSERKKRFLEFTTIPNSIKFKIPESLYHVFKEVFMEDFYEIDKLIKMLPDNPVVIDVGANAGLFDVLLLSKIKNAQILAYEPIQANVSMFQNTIDNNHLLKSVQLFQAAVTGLPMNHVKMFTQDVEENTVISSVFSDFSKMNNKMVVVEARSLTSILKEHQLKQVDLLKLDCEGSEYDIIYNTEPAILKSIKMMVIEVHQINEENHNLISLVHYLNSNGYTTRWHPVQEGSYYLHAKIK